MSTVGTAIATTERVGIQPVDTAATVAVRLLLSPILEPEKGQ